MYPCAPARPPKDVGRKSLRALRFGDSHSPRRARRTRRFGFYRVFSVISVISVVDFHPYRWVASPCNTQDDIFKFMDKSRLAAHNFRRVDPFGRVARIHHQPWSNEPTGWDNLTAPGGGKSLYRIKFLQTLLIRPATYFTTISPPAIGRTGTAPT